MKVVFIDGGLGRNICAIPAVEKLAEKEDVIVIATWIEPWMNNEKIERVYHVSHPYLWEDVISKADEYIHPEPYTYPPYFRQQKHLAQAFWELILKEEAPPLEKLKPNIYLSYEEIINAKNLLKKIKNDYNFKKIIVFQPFGASAFLTEDRKVIDESNRSLPLDVVKQIIEKIPKDVGLLYFGHIPAKEVGFNRFRNLILLDFEISTRLWISIISQSDGVFGVDSSGLHIAAAFNKPHLILFGGTYPENLAWKTTTVYRKKGYPKTYDPIRIPSINLVNPPNRKNKGALNFNSEEINKILELFNKTFNINYKQ